ncbi:MAG: alpha-rhamnosidase, partial [Bacteroidales bacterium]|nr:alpha-rhamnosidase [Bacteroidales bacterium]
GSQLDLVYPLLTGVTPSELREKVVSALKERTATVYDGHLATGLVGVPVITRWATLSGEAEWLYGLLKQHSYPGYLYMLDSGATGVWEEWDGGRSHLHNCYNGIGSWFYEALAGIVPLEPGYRRVRIAPQLTDKLDWVKATVGTPYGPLTVRRQGKEIQVDAPVGIEIID